MLIRNVILDWSGTLIDYPMPVFRTADHLERLRATSPDLVCEHLGELQQTLAEQVPVHG